MQALQHAHPNTCSRRSFIAGSSAAAGVVLSACGPARRGQEAPRQEIRGVVEVWGITRFPFDKEVGGDIAREVEARTPGLRIQFTVASDDSTQKLRVAAAAGTAPDLDSVNGLTIQGLALDGLAASMEPYLKTSKVIKKADLWPAFIQEHSWKGVLHGMAYGPDMRLLYLGSDLYTRVGLDLKKPPKTWTDLEQAIAKTLQRNGQRIEVLGFDPFIGTGIKNLWVVPFWQLGAELLSPDGTKVTIANDKGLKAWEWLKKIIDQQGGWAAMQEFKQGRNPNQLFVDGKMSHYYATNSERSETLRRLAPNLQFGFTTYPLPPGGRRATFGGVHTFVIPRGAKLPNGAWLFLEHLLADDNNLRFADSYDRVPVRKSVAHSDRYIRDDVFRKLVVEDMAGRRWLIPAPGAWDMRAEIMGVATDILENGVAIMVALSKAQDSIQIKLDRALSATK